MMSFASIARTQSLAAKYKNIKELNIMSIYENLKKGTEKLSLVGLGYVGMPIAVAFAKKALRL